MIKLNSITSQWLPPKKFCFVHFINVCFFITIILIWDPLAFCTWHEIKTAVLDRRCIYKRENNQQIWLFFHKERRIASFSVLYQRNINREIPIWNSVFNYSNKKNGLKSTELKCLTKQSKSICINIVRLANTHLTIVEVSFITIKVTKFLVWHVW